MRKNSKILLLILLAAAFRLPFLLFRGGPESDEMRYFAESLCLFGIDKYRGYLDLVDFDKIFYIVVIAPFTTLMHLLGGSPALSIGFFPFVAGLTFVILLYIITEKIAGEAPAFWAGFIWAGLPSVVYYSASAETHTFYAYFFILGCWLLYKYFESGRGSYFLAASAIFFSLSKIRLEGLLVFLIFLAVVIQKERRAGTDKKKIAGKIVLAALMSMLLWLAYLGMSIHVFGFRTGEGYGQLFRNVLGYLTLKLDALFGAGTPGGFLQADKLKYAAENPGLVILVLLGVSYDVLKTLFVVPFRLVPPLLLPFLGLAFGGMAHTSRTAKAIVWFMALSLLSIFIYPVFWFSASRFVYLVVPLAVILIAVGFGQAEALIDQARGAAGRIVTGRSILSVLTLAYLVFLNLQFTPGFIKAGLGPAVSYEPVNRWLQKNFERKNIAIMCRSTLAFKLGREFVPFPLKVGRMDGHWRPVPVSAEEVAGIVQAQGNVLVIVAKTELYGNPPSTEELNYFSRSLPVNLPFIGDESLENMQMTSNLNSAYYFQEFVPIVRGERTVQGLNYIGPVETPDETYYVFASDLIAENLQPGPPADP